MAHTDHVVPMVHTVHVVLTRLPLPLGEGWGEGVFRSSVKEAQLATGWLA